MASLVLDQLDAFGPDHCEQLDYEQADAMTRELTESQYENFTVVSWLLPKRFREDFRHVYAFCRWADDLGDETGDPQRSLELLEWWRTEVDQCYAGRPRHPVFVALARTIEKRNIPRKPFDDLIDAFVQDQRVTRYDTWEQVIDYCSRSADPVGRLVLYVCGYDDDQRQRLSDQTCTALQLVNFWQDVRRDVLERDRVYIPQNIARQHGLDIDTMVSVIKADGAARGDCGPACCDGRKLPSAGITAIEREYCATVRDLCERTRPMFELGRALLPMVASDIRVDIKLFTLGGEAILRRIRSLGYNTLRERPSLSKGAKVALMLRAVSGKMTSVVRGGGRV
mgnify:CR=1 FL=1